SSIILGLSIPRYSFINVSSAMFSLLYGKKIWGLVSDFISSILQFQKWKKTHCRKDYYTNFIFGKTLINWYLCISKKINAMNNIPSVDLADFLSEDPKRKQKFVDEIGSAYEDIGFVSLKNHFLSDQLV